MTAQKINNGLIEVIKTKVPAGTNIARVLMDLLCIGKEAVYRRLRGDVPFTFAEAAVISRKMGISLDKLISTSSSHNAIFDLNMASHDDPTEAYYLILENFVKLTEPLDSVSESEMGMVANVVPMSFTMKYELLSKLRFVKWMYQEQKIGMGNKLQDVVMADKINEKQKEYVTRLDNIDNIYYIWDNMLFMSLVNDIRYFQSINMIGDDDVRMLRDEMLAMVDSMLLMANSGKSAVGNKVSIYISNINFEATYFYMQALNFNLSMLRMFSVNSITSKDADVTVNLREWVNSFKKFSILISQSGEMQRIQFFNKQKEIIRQIEV